MKATVDGKPVDVSVTVHLRWDPPLETIIDAFPVAEVLKIECIALTAARASRQVRREALEELEATMQKPSAEPNHG